MRNQTNERHKRVEILEIRPLYRRGRHKNTDDLNRSRRIKKTEELTQTNYTFTSSHEVNILDKINQIKT